METFHCVYNTHRQSGKLRLPTFRVFSLIRQVFEPVSTISVAGLPPSSVEKALEFVQVSLHLILFSASLWISRTKHLTKSKSDLEEPPNDYTFAAAFYLTAWAVFIDRLFFAALLIQYQSIYSISDSNFKNPAPVILMKSFMKKAKFCISKSCRTFPIWKRHRMDCAFPWADCAMRTQLYFASNIQEIKRNWKHFVVTHKQTLVIQSVQKQALFCQGKYFMGIQLYLIH